MLHPNRSALVHSLGYGMVLLALLIVVLGYIVPRFALPALSDNMWADVSARLANDSLPLLVGLAIVLGGGGLMLLVGNRTAAAPTPMERARQHLPIPRRASLGLSRTYETSSATNSANTSA